MVALITDHIVDIMTDGTAADIIAIMPDTMTDIMMPHGADATIHQDIMIIIIVRVPDTDMDIVRRQLLQEDVRHEVMCIMWVHRRAMPMLQNQPETDAQQTAVHRQQTDITDVMPIVQKQRITDQQRQQPVGVQHALRAMMQIQTTVGQHVLPAMMQTRTTEVQHAQPQPELQQQEIQACGQTQTPAIITTATG